MALFGKKKEEQTTPSPEFVKVGYDEKLNPVDVRPAIGPSDFPPVNLSDKEKQWFEKWFNYLIHDMNMLKDETIKASLPQGVTSQLNNSLERWKTQLNQSFEIIFQQIKSATQNKDLIEQLNRLNGNIKELRHDINSDIIPKDDLMNRMIDIQTKVNRINQEVYQNLKKIDTTELKIELEKSFKEILDSYQKRPKKKEEMKITADIYKRVLDKIIKENLNVKPLERVLVLTDKNMLRIGRLFYETSRQISLKTILVVMERKTRDGEEPDDNIADMMKEADVIIVPTFYSLTHTKAVRDAMSQGARVLSMARIPIFSFIEGGLTADFGQVKSMTEKIFDLTKNIKEIHVLSNNGTDVKFSVEGRKWFKDLGVAHNMGEIATLPPGEVFVSTIESTVNGKIVFDQVEPKANVELTVEEGVIKKLKGSVTKVNELFSKLGVKAITISEFGIGCNSKAKFVGNISEDKKALGMVRFGLGSNISFDGNVDVQSHRDGVINRPTVSFNGIQIIKDGLLVE